MVAGAMFSQFWKIRISIILTTASPIQSSIIELSENFIIISRSLIDECVDADDEFRWINSNHIGEETTVNQERFRTLQIKLSDVTNWLILLAIIGLLSSIGLGWLVNGILVIIGLIALTPVLVITGVQWWLKRNLIHDQCPVCQYEFTALNKTQCQCPNCGEPLQVEQGHFNRLTPPGTIDVQAIDVSVKQLED